MRSPSFLDEPLTELCVDASSVIYLLKAGLLGSLAAEVSLVAPPEILEEVGWPHLPVEALDSGAPEGMSHDDRVVLLARRRQSPVLSEDYELLSHARQEGLPYYNALMMLSYLLLRGRVSPGEYPLYLERLRECAHYAAAVWDEGERVRRQVLERLGEAP